MNIHTSLIKASRTMVMALSVAALISTPLAQTSFAADTTSTVTLRIDVRGSTKEVVIELDETNAPKTCANFKKLADQGFYDGIAFHRVIPNYIVQAGDPLTKDASQKNLWGTGGPGYTLQAEIGLPHERGSVAMARLGDSVNSKKASSGSQFYIALARLPKLDREYTVFGKVISGLEHLDHIASSPVDGNNNPGERIEIVAASVAGGVARTTAAATVPSPADTAPATQSKSSKVDAGSMQAAVDSKPKKESWFKRKFSKGKKNEVAEVEEAMPEQKAAPDPVASVASSDEVDVEEVKKESWLKRKFGKRKKDEVAAVEESMPAPKPKPAPKPAAPVASNDSAIGNEGVPTYRNESQSTSRSTIPAPTEASDDDATSLASEMKTSPPEDDNDARASKERGLVGRFLYRYW
jgi:peptidyl-prolyl cis-trans isomerase B (cyclophilin B)